MPLELTPFIGRDDESIKIGELLQDSSHRLLTLVGVGGIGKTRLALHAAAALVDGYSDGVWLVEFANLSDPGLVPQHAAAVLGVSAQAYRNLNPIAQVQVVREEYEQLVGEFQKLRGGEVFEGNYAEGFAMSLEDAIAYALGEIDEI